MSTRSPSRSSQRRGAARSSKRALTVPPATKTPWAVLIYLAGDVKYVAKELRANLRQVLALKPCAELTIAVQHDSPKGASRYLIPQGGTETSTPTEKLGEIDSGSPDVLADFLRWGLSVCPAERTAVVLNGLSALDPAPMGSERGPSRVFTICRDESHGNFLDVVEIGTVVRTVLAEFGRDTLELLAVDSCRVQFLELAYELEGRVQVLLASQTSVPGAGWHYTRVLHAWRDAIRAAGGQLSTEALARELVPAISQTYASAQPDYACGVSALDLRRLDDFARAFDTFCIGMMQALGEGLIWETRGLIISLFEDVSDTDKRSSYDTGSLLALLSAGLDAMADEAFQGWLGTTLKRVSGAQFDRFRMSVATVLERAPATCGPRLRVVLQALRSSEPAAAGATVHHEIDVGIRNRLKLLGAGPSGTRKFTQANTQARLCDETLADAIQSSLSALGTERQFDLERLKESRELARRLARQARQAAAMLLGDEVVPLTTSDALSPRPGLVIVSITLNADPTRWPRWSGVSLYRPPKLDELMSASYQSFAFHNRVHWAALLGAANLIEHHPRALWRLVCSLLATGGAGTRRDVLRRLTGADSVIWGLREQFRPMAPAPALTLSLERGNRDGERKSRGGASHEHYLLRLESANRGAIITEQLSRVQPELMQRALRELEDLLSAPSMNREGFRRLKAVGGLLGDDILQSLGRTLDEERTLSQDDLGAGHVHLQLQIPRELMAYPWELMHHRGEWLSERFAVGRQVFMATGLARRVPRRRQGRVRILVIGDPILNDSSWSQLPGAQAEAEQVVGYFLKLKEQMGEVIDFDPARDAHIHTRLTNADFRALLRDGDYDIVHFAGHGVFDADDPETSAWLLSDGKLWALELRNTLAEHPAPPWLIYANACEAAMESRAVKYQGNVFGLATACINEGVAAFIAPLWPIDDLLAQQIALTFYHELFSERASLGEALRRAKADARRIATPASNGNGFGQEDGQAWASLGWASLVLYGDATEEMFQALAGSERRNPVGFPQAGNDALFARNRLQARVEKTRASFLHAPDQVLHAWVDDPEPLRRAAATRGGDGTAEVGAERDRPQLELIEEAGLRRWRVRQPGQTERARTRGSDTGGDGLPGSDFARLLAHPAIRAKLPGQRGIIRVIGRWIVSGFDDGLTGFVREYDREEVPREGLLLIDGTKLAPLTPANLPAATKERDRVLLLVHGTFSKTASPVEGFGAAFIAWAQERYRAVIGLDHWTLSKDPLENAELLASELKRVAPELLEEKRLDVITHSRGGLVARAFCELLPHAGAVKNLIFLGTPNCGTDLANPKNWGAMADMLINLTGVDHARVFGRLAGLLARLAMAGGMQKIPGLLAQNPLMAAQDSFLKRLQAVDADADVRHAVITAEFEPSPFVPNLKGLWEAAKSAGIDASIDSFFQDGNDLVVNTRHVWCLGQPPSAAASLPAFLKSERVLAFAPADTDVVIPKGVHHEVLTGVHHCNLFSQPLAQAKIRSWLEEA